MFVHYFVHVILDFGAVNYLFPKIKAAVSGADIWIIHEFQSCIFANQIQ